MEQEQHTEKSLEDAHTRESSSKDIAKTKDKALRTSTSSTYSGILKDGFLCQKTEHYRLPGAKHGSSAGIGKTWKVYRAVLRGTKLYFYKAPSLDIDYRILFPVNGDKNSTGDISITKKKPLPLSRDGSVASTRPGTPANETVNPKPSMQETNLEPSPPDMSDKGLMIVPSMLDASTRLLLFSETTVPLSPKVSRPDSPSVKPSTSSLISKYQFGDAFIEVDFPDYKFKQQLVLLILDDNIMVLTKKWVRITRSIEVSEKAKILAESDSVSRVRLSDNKLGGSYSEILASTSSVHENPASMDRPPRNESIDEKINIIKGSSAKTMTKLTFDVTYPLSKVTIAPFDTLNVSAGGSESSTDLMYGFELRLPDKTKRYFRARHSLARDRFIERFSFATKMLLSPQSQSTKVTASDIAKAWGQDYSSSNSNDQSKANSKRTRKFWGVAKHPELVLKGISSVDQDIIGASIEGYIHEFIFRNLKHLTNDFYQNVAYYFKSICSSYDTSQVVIEEIRRLLQMSFEKPEAIANTAIIRVFELLMAIIESVDVSILQRIESLLQMIQCRENMNETCTSGLKVTRKALADHISLLEGSRSLPREPLNSYTVDLSSGSLSTTSLLKIPTEELARQIFVYHGRRYMQLFEYGIHKSAVDMAVNIWEGAYVYEDGNMFFIMSHIVKGTEEHEPIVVFPYVQPLTQFVMRQIIVSAKSYTPEKRASVIKYWIKVSEELLNKFGDVYGWVCVASALLSTEVVRLSESWKYIPKRYVDMLSTWVPLLLDPVLLKQKSWLPYLADLLLMISDSSFQLYDSSESELFKKGWIVQSSINAVSKLSGFSQRHYDRRALGLALESHIAHPDLQNWLRSVYSGQFLESLEVELTPLDLLRGVMFPTISSETTNAVLSMIRESKKKFLEDSMLCEGYHYYVAPSSVLPPSMNHVQISEFPTYFDDFYFQSSDYSSRSNAKTKLTENWKLLPDNNFELIFAHDPQSTTDSSFFLKAASIERLIDYLVLESKDLNDIDRYLFPETSFRNHDDLYFQTFFAVYRSICKPTALMEDLLKRFNEIPSARAKIVIVFKFWVDNYFEDFLDDLMLTEKLFKVLSMFAKYKLDEHTSQTLQSIKEFSIQKLHVPTRSLVESPESPQGVLVSFDIDQTSSSDLSKNLQALSADVYEQVTASEWIQYLNVIIGASPYVVIDFHSFSRALRNSTHVDDPYEVMDVFSAVSFLNVPASFVPKSSLGFKSSSFISLTKIQSPTRELASKTSNQSMGNISSTPHTLLPLKSILPYSIQKLFDFHENLRLWTIHLIASATSIRHRIARIKLLLDTAKAVRKSCGESTGIVRAILSGLVSVNSRIFIKAWMTLSEMPVDGVDLKGKKSDHLPFESAETYIELLEALWTESPSMLSEKNLLEKVPDQITFPPSIEDSLEYFIHYAFDSPDTFLVEIDDEDLKLIPPSESNSSVSKGISADTGLPLINFEKRLFLYQIARRLSWKKTPSVQKSIDLGFLLEADGISSKPELYITDLPTAVSLSKADSESKASKSKIAFFVKLSEAEKDLRKRREREWKRVSEIIEKDKDRVKKDSESADSSKKLDVKQAKNLGIGNSNSSASPLLSSLLRMNTFKSKVISNSRSTIDEVPLSAASTPDLSSDRQTFSLDRGTARPMTAVAESSSDSRKTFTLISAAADPRYTKPVKTVSLVHSRSHVASDYTKRPFVFRILTEDDQEILLQAVSKQELQEWIRKLNDVSKESVKKITGSGTALDTDPSTSTSEENVRPGTAESSPEKKTKFGFKKLVDTVRKPEKTDDVSGRTFGVDLVQILLREIQERQHYEAQQSIIYEKDSVAMLQFWKKAKPPAETAGYLTVDPLGLKHAKWNEFNSLPIVVEKCIKEVDARGLEEVGIYRISGSNVAVKELKKAFDTDPHTVDLTSSDYVDINIISGTLKLWFRELPEPLVTFELFDRFMGAAEIQEYDDRLIRIKELIQMLPRPNFFILRRLLEHLDRVTDYEEKNHMYASNLAIVFGPTLMKPPPSTWYQSRGLTAKTPAGSNSALGSQTLMEISYDHLSDLGSGGSMELASTMKHLGACNSLVKNMILQYHWLFDIEREEEEEEKPSVVEEFPSVVEEMPSDFAGADELTAVPDGLDPGEEYFEEVLDDPVTLSSTQKQPSAIETANEIGQFS